MHLNFISATVDSPATIWVHWRWMSNKIRGCLHSVSCKSVWKLHCRLTHRGDDRPFYLLNELEKKKENPPGFLLICLSHFPSKAKTTLKCPSVRLKIEEAHTISKKGMHLFTLMTITHQHLSRRRTSDHYVFHVPLFTIVPFFFFS